MTMAFLKIGLLVAAVACFHNYTTSHNVWLLGVGMWFTIAITRHRSEE